jgi:hypothetical protein
MSALPRSKAFRDANDVADDVVTDALGLFSALEAVMETHPALINNDPRNTALWAVMRSLGGKIKETDAAIQGVWNAAKEETTESPEIE